jgi:hypothetical protein
MITIEGQLEIDKYRGVIYFNSNKGVCVLRICNLPVPITAQAINDGLDVTHLINANWTGHIRFRSPNEMHKIKK